MYLGGIFMSLTEVPLSMHFKALNSTLKEIQARCKGMNDIQLTFAIQQSLGIRNVAPVQICIARYRPVCESDIAVSPIEKEV